MRESINLYEGVLNFFFRRQYPFWLDILPNAKTSKNFNVGLESRKSAEVKIYSPNALCRWRAKTFFTKEPETLRWINQFGGDQKVFFDIGANIGLYSIYYSSLFAGKVFAFEPSVFNLECLTRNLNLNNLQDQVVVMTNPLSHRSGVEEFQLQSTEQGGALSGFGVSYGQDGRSLQSVFSYLSYGFSLDAMFESGIISDVPSMIKLDVDGIENLILRGAQKVISDDRCETILVEVNSDFKKLSNEVVEILEKCGFEVNEIQSWNQIWVKSRL
jgi:FkbM family methyltransferase